MGERTQSLRALDALNFFNAGIQTGLGPFIAIFYSTGLHWNPGQIGALLAVMSLAGVISQSFIGNAVDQTEHKQAAAALAAAIVVLGCLGIVLMKGFAWQVAVQATIGVAVTVFPAATSAFALGLVKPEEVSARIARNESYTHAGNVVFAAIAAAVGLLFAVRYILVAAAIFAGGMGFAAFAIRGQDINHEAARGGQEGGEDGKKEEPKGWRELIKDQRILIFTATVVLFNVGNSSTLPLVAQLLSKGQKGGAIWQTSACVGVAEVVMVLVAWLIGRRVDVWGRKPLFLGAFALLAVRNALTNVSHAQGYLISLQTLDGVAAAIYGVLLTLVAADLARGSGRFNFLQGAMGSAMGLGAFLSNLLFGYLAHALGFAVSFWGLSAAAIAGGLLYLWKMPETKPEG